MEDGDIVVGLMSGTSMDGVDVCIIKIAENESNQSCHLNFSIMNHSVYDYPPGLKDDLLTLCCSGHVCHVSQYNVLLGQLFVEAVLRALKENGITPRQVKLIGSHGQTVYHQPISEQLHNHTVSSTLQIGDPSTIAITSGITTVGDFRLADMACGGQGAPLVPYLDQLLARRHFVNTNRIAVFLNVGGISNIFTMNHNNGSSIGFDTGPGNILIDGLMKILYNENYDNQGHIGATGTLNSTLLQFLINEDTFITRRPPKSSGREYYNDDYIEKILKKSQALELKNEDIINTVTAFTGHAVYYNYKEYVMCHLNNYKETEIDLLVSGGGAKNNYLMSCLKEKFNKINVSTTDIIDIPVDCKEALCFAILGYETFKYRPTNLPSVTGADKQVILGKICPIFNS